MSSSISTITCQGLSSNYQVDSATYGVQGLLMTDNQPPQQSSFDNRSMNYSYPSSYGMNTSDQLMPSWSKFPQFLRTSPPKQPTHGQLHFSNNAPFWNASSTTMNDVRSSLFPSLQTQVSMPSYEEKPKVKLPHNA